MELTDNTLCTIDCNRTVWFTIFILERDAILTGVCSKLLFHLPGKMSFEAFYGCKPDTVIYCQECTFIFWPFVYAPHWTILLLGFVTAFMSDTEVVSNIKKKVYANTYKVMKPRTGGYEWRYMKRCQNWALTPQSCCQTETPWFYLQSNFQR